MTEKTDIAALRRRSNNLRTADQTDAFIDLLLDKLEAERQQREASEKERERIDRRNAELNSTLERWSVERAEGANEIEELRAELRGEQEPVDERVIVAAADLFVIPSRNGVGSYYVTDAAEAMRISKRNDNSAITQYVTMRKYQELFTRQPKPVVVLPKITTERAEWTTWQWIEHLGGRFQHGNPGDYVEFGSVFAVQQMLKQFQRTSMAIMIAEVREILESAGIVVKDAE